MTSPTMMSDSMDWSSSQAVLIGVSTYQDHSYLSIPAAANSLNAFYSVLTDPQMCEWPTKQITLLSNPSDTRAVAKLLRRLAQQTQDILLIYYVGHGTVTAGGELCLTLTDTDADAADLTGLEYARVRAAFRDSPARVKIAILDCCYSGRAIEILTNQETVVADQTDVRGVYTLTASDYAAHVPPLWQQATTCTSFTGELLALIRDGIVGQPDMLTLGTLYLELRRRLLTQGLPAPNQRGTDTAHSFAFTKNVALARQIKSGTATTASPLIEAADLGLTPHQAPNHNAVPSDRNSEPEAAESVSRETLTQPPDTSVEPEAQRSDTTPADNGTNALSTNSSIGGKLGQLRRQIMGPSLPSAQKRPSITVSYPEIADGNLFVPMASVPGTVAYKLSHLPRRLVLIVAVSTAMVSVSAGFAVPTLLGAQRSPIESPNVSPSLTPSPFST
ncbi:caspase family protein [Nonomuraea sp. NPDC049141]|uniref:caspase family protein n=1 Tax=Nonomuraea sp. NPDC049141 TaxID=3155500 RepID=UPI0033E58589